MYDYVIIGAGVIGSLIARELSKYDVKVIVLEEQNDSGNVTSMANSAIIHVPFNEKPNSLKARLCLEGNLIYPQVCEELDVTYKKIGAYVCATNNEETKKICELLENTVVNGAIGRILTFDEAKQLEPHLSENVQYVLELPDTAIIDPFELTIHAMENAMENGVELALNTKVLEIKKETELFQVITNQLNYHTRYIINCAGLYADVVAQMIEKETLFSIRPTRGEYYLLSKQSNYITQRIFYPIPSNKGKGILIIPTVHGNIMVGPTSERVERDSNNNTRSGLEQIKQESIKVMKNIPFQNTIRTFAGIRAKGSLGDFYIQESKEISNLIHVAGIDSPGLASAPAIAKYVVNEIVLKKESLELKEKYNPYVKKRIRMNELSIEERNKVIDTNKKYGHIVCRCEQITEGEIIDCIQRQNGATTIKGVKKRVRAGMGVCQGGFCESLVIDLLANKLNVPKTSILYDELHSEVLIEELKVNTHEEL